MAEIVLFHHVRGLTGGVLAFAEILDAAGHTVHTPDLFDGERPASIDAGLGHVRELGCAALQERVDMALGDLPRAIVYAGIGWGGDIAQVLAQTRDGALGALLYESCIPLTGPSSPGPWPDGVPVQVHGMADDPFFGQGTDLAGARDLVERVGPDHAELFVYPGARHLFTDRTLPSYDAGATGLVLERSQLFLAALDRAPADPAPV